MSFLIVVFGLLALGLLRLAASLRVLKQYERSVQLYGTSRRLGGRSATVTARADLGIHRVLNAHRIDRVLRRPSGQANRPVRAPASGRIA